MTRVPLGPIPFEMPARREHKARAVEQKGARLAHGVA